ncbi:Asp-tRNA(Asn)/Glu-tRNA(Gln) amidotransferase subunit GatA [Candidatus Kinetoplastidibacterium crithidiae]|uniref:Glutamyl-tRNA(Gln) amidotransferase subunit A n=1 Tax=Candidatus Kinetoplastidibacterium crithidiae TCC036E TaxID=1208918 RepID=M1LV22_9PROT|nr:Asp-tRNA(Asn)/Glu-tRNA(Gln) amidotransferase subunit GatA [Candidatus Kinetoplastibacterium crithidii]AFZ82947.1 aspartyl-tRNA(Asn)/glutamyl-tRNA (Gln) amidotransferase subunit A [Candidatus Kinetoplastibacterium crithidii (ex Angomonas deanei ATCC 30255)]AGF47946.1 aspartyl-tRNA(Asn)/glutamyl-tRNA (Gln) amidotransferase subunit A [Candidatus Kinetoplastibacterium crithidii TCC036E]
MTKKPLHTQFDGINELRDAILKKDISVLEITKSALEKAKDLEYLNIFLHLDEELTLQQAKEADKNSSDSSKILTGIPIAHKDNIATKQWHTTAGSKMLENYISPFNATVVDKLKEFGSISLGKLNCDEFGMGSNNENSAYGPVKNPWDIRITPGGSSGGSAAAVAARIVMASTGTDTGGSIRMPAALCGVCGIKPTYGTVSRYGVIAFASSLDQVGVFANSSLDLLEILNTISDYDHKDSTSIKKYCSEEIKTGWIKKSFNNTKNSFRKNSSSPLKDIRIGIPKEFFDMPIDEDILKTTKEAIHTFEKLGADIINISIPHTEIAIPTYYVIASAEASSNLARYDGVHYGYRTSTFKNIEEMISRSRAEGFGNEVKIRTLLGNYLLSKNNYEQFYLKAQKIRRIILNSFQKIFHTECDLIMGPVTMKNTKKIGIKNINDTDWLDDIYTVSANLAGLPAMSIPCGFNKSDDSHPIGLQIIGNYFSEPLMIAISDCYQQNTNWHKKLPDNI